MQAALKNQESYAFHPSILREYDIRGVMEETLSEADAYALGRVFAGYVGETTPNPKICVGYDGRLSSPALEAALTNGLKDGGAQVLRIGRGPTPMLYFATYHLDADAGVMITGSHNPPTHNGFKMMAHGKSVFGATIKSFGARALAGQFGAGQGSTSDTPVFDAYVARLVQGFAKGGKALRVAWDAGNGAGGEVLAAMVRQLDGEHILLNEVIDGTFPAHHPDPTVAENLQQLIACVKEKNCDLGIAFDGDADRIGVVDAEGVILWGDQLIAVYAEEVLAKHKGATVIADVKASDYTFARVKQLGGNPLMWKTGHSHIKTKMKETGAPLAGEMSGHIFFADDYYGFDDALYAGIRLLNVLSVHTKTLAQIRADFPVSYSTPEIRMNCAEEHKFAIVERVAAQLKASAEAFLDVDGVRAQTPDGWWLLRASNTQAILVARAEASSEEGLARLTQRLQEVLAKEGLQLVSDGTH